MPSNLAVTGIQYPSTCYAPSQLFFSLFSLCSPLSMSVSAFPLLPVPFCSASYSTSRSHPSVFVLHLSLLSSFPLIFLNMHKVDRSVSVQHV